MHKSLRKFVFKFSKDHFPELHKTSWNPFAFLNKKSSVIWVFPITLGAFLLGQVCHPGWLQVLHVADLDARTIIDQRSTNLATLFSITLVVIGWLITNISNKETISYQLLFKETFLYPIFYFVMSIVACLMIFSLLRDEKYVDITNIVIAGTILILFALVCIVWLFRCLIKIVDPAFFYSALEGEVMKEVYAKARPLIIGRKSRSIYKEFCEQFLFSDRRQWGGYPNHVGINISRLEEQEPGDEGADIFATRKRYLVRNINLKRLNRHFISLNLAGDRFYVPLQIDSLITENFHAFFIDNAIPFSADMEQKISCAFDLKEVSTEPPPVPSTPFFDNLEQRYLKDVKDGKRENIEMALSIYNQIFDLENKIYSLC